MSGRITCCLVVLLCLTILSCGEMDSQKPVHGNNGKPAYGDAIVVGSIGEPSTLLPVLASDSASFDISDLIYNGLVKYDKDLKLVGVLAESWDVSRDGLTITFHLRKGVKWHDGRQFSSHDVLYTYQVIINPKTPTAYAESFKQVNKAEAPDPYTFCVTYAKPYAPALESWAMLILPSHLLEGKDLTKSELARHPVGTGPYKFREWVPVCLPYHSR
jgi:peptide/nickel transport system substrate-binding protein